LGFVYFYRKIKKIEERDKNKKIEPRREVEACNPSKNTTHTHLFSFSSKEKKH